MPQDRSREKLVGCHHYKGEEDAKSENIVGFGQHDKGDGVLTAEKNMEGPMPHYNESRYFERYKGRDSTMKTVSRSRLVRPILRGRIEGHQETDAGNCR